MSDEQTKQIRINELKARRVMLAEEKEKAEKRTDLGPFVVGKVNSVLKTNLTIEQFDVEKQMPASLDRQPNLGDCQGLVAAHISESRIRQILSCCEHVVGQQSGFLGFDEYGFVGIANVESIQYLQLLDVAKSIHDSVIFCPCGYDSIIVVDHYVVRGFRRDVNFSVVIQGAQLESELEPCFETVVRFRP